jgi:hypothetical protein
MAAVDDGGPSPTESIGLRDEARRILRLAGDDALRAFDIVERQLAVLVLRTQVLLSLSGIVITVTGFSGRAIAQTSDLARACISMGIFGVLGAAVVAIVGVLRLRWFTQVLADDPLVTLSRGLEIRERKSRALALALALFVAGFTLYCIAISQLLWRARP